MLFKEDSVARADAEAIRKGVGFYRWTHDLVEITGADALEVLQKIYISDLSRVPVGKSKYTASLDENGEVIVNYLRFGDFLSAFINFVIMAFVVFLIVKTVNRLREAGEKHRKKEAEAPAAPPEPLLTRDVPTTTTAGASE